MPLGLDKLLKDFSININGLIGKLPFEHSWINVQNIYYKGTLPKWLKGYAEILKNLSILIHSFSIYEYYKFYNRINYIGLHKLNFKIFHQFVIDFKINLMHCIILP